MAASAGNYANSMQGPIAGSAAGGGINSPYDNPVNPQAYANQAQPFNMNTAAAQGVQGALAGAAQGMGFNSARQGAGYMNPYMRNVAGNLTGEAFRNYEQLNNALGAQASKAGAFGGSRHGVAQAQLGQGVMRDLNSQIGNLAYQGYSDALSNARQDQAMRLGAASQLGNTANLGFQMGRQVNQDMLMQGAMQQALQQMAMDKASGQYQGFQQSPYTALNQYASILGQVPYSTTQSSTTTGGGQNYGLFDYMGMGLYGADKLGWI